jgi:hypothetical protein
MFYISTIKDQTTLTVSKSGQTSLVQQERTSKRADCPPFIQPPDLPQKMLPNYWRFQVQVLAAISNIKCQEYVLLIIWPQLTFSAMEYFWDPDINYPAPIPIIAHAYLLLTLSSMHALTSPPGINHFTHRTQPSRYNLDSTYTQGTDAQLTPRNDRAAPRA